MTWINDNEQHPFAAMDIPGLESETRPYAPGQRWYQVRWPSGVVTDIFADREDPTDVDKLDIHIFGEMDLPYRSTRDEAYELAFDIGECCGYYARKLTGDRLQVQGGYEPHPYTVTYKDGVIVNVERK